MENAIWHAWNEQQTFPEGKDFFLYFDLWYLCSLKYYFMNRNDNALLD